MSPTFDRRVAVVSAVHGIVLEYIPGKEAAAKFASGSVKIEYDRPGVGVVCVRMAIGIGTDGLPRTKTVKLDAKPGSFGIHREGTDHGTIIFEHKETWDRALAAA
jgi:hypothetical protein